MTLITTYATLQSAVADYLNRSDMTEQIKTFIQLAEQDLRRNLLPLPVKVASNLIAGQDYYTLFNGELISVQLDTDSYKHPITLTSLTALAELKRAGSGVPLYGAADGSKLYLDVEIDSNYDVILFYKPTLVPLSDSATSNAILVSAPDAYLYGALKEAAPFLEHDERNILWAQKYQKAVSDENLARERAQYGEGIVVPRMPIILG